MAVSPRVFALNEALVALKRHFGERRFRGPYTEIEPVDDEGRKLDIVIVTVEGRNVLHLIDVDPGEYDVEYFTGDPMFLGFETQRIARERGGDYDVVGMMEDDLVINDPAFLDKVLWFNRAFGPKAVLQPHRVEVSRAGLLAKTMIEPSLAPHFTEQFRHPGEPEMREGEFAGRPRRFARTTNPHSGCWFLTGEQVQDWSREPYFYDREPSWVGPLESAATRAFALKHCVYRAVDPDPFFLEIEHFGVSFATQYRVGGISFQTSPFLTLKGFESEDSTQLHRARVELAELREEHQALNERLKSRKELLHRFLRLTWSRIGRS